MRLFSAFASSFLFLGAPGFTKRCLPSILISEKALIGTSRFSYPLKRAAAGASAAGALSRKSPMSCTANEFI